MFKNLFLPKVKVQGEGLTSSFWRFVSGLIWIAGLFILIVIVSALFLVGSTKTTIVELPQGSSVKAIVKKMSDDGVLKTPALLEMYIRARGWSKKVRAGRYEIKVGMTPADIARKLVEGDVLNYPFTVVEGWTINETAAALVGKPFLQNPDLPKQYVALAKDPALIKELGFTGLNSLEGYLFPDTYEFPTLTDAKDLIKMQVKKFNEVFTNVEKEKAKALGYTPEQALIIASLVEKETGVPEERPLVAAVIYNRLKKNMLLQIDPTVIYGIPNFNGNLTKNDLMRPTPYNTYVNPGLPAGPICNPGLAAIQAALNPAPVDYLYFVSKNNGTHEFTSDLASHMKAVMRYQLNREIAEPEKKE